VARMSRMKLHAWFSEEYLKKKNPVGRLGYTWGEGGRDNIKMDLEEIRCKSVDWNCVAQDRTNIGVL